jgi:D-alanine-D-alanine ligase
MGGTSAEREVSLETGNAVCAALRRRSVDVHSIDTRDAFMRRLIEEKFDRVFIALHGRRGEDGVIQGALDTLELPYTGSGVLGSALAMDKVRTKWIWQSRGIPTPDFVVLRNEADLESVGQRIGFPVMIKPVHEGSSCGAGKVTRAQDLAQAWRAARALDEHVMAERWVDGAEYTVGILGSRVLPMIRLETPREFYDYEAKYLADTTRYICPCGLDAEAERRIGKMAMEGFEAVNAAGWGRVDLLVDNAGLPWFIEVNTIPGMTSHSLVPMAARQAGIDFDDLVIRILETSLAGGKAA